MKKIRIGKDISISWRVLTNGEAVSLEGRDLTLHLIDPLNRKMQIPFTVEDVLLEAKISGTTQKFLGKYSLTLWENYGKPGQTAVDACNAFELVKTTCMEGGADEGLDTETVELEGDMCVGVKGDDGKSAYQVAVDNGFKGTEEEWLASLKGEPFTYSDFTPEQIAELKRPATEAAAAANQAAENAQQAAQKANDSAASANAAATKAESAAKLATQATEQVNDAISGAEAAGQSATAAALIAEQKANLANSAAQEASESAEAASQSALKAEEATEQAQSATASANSAAESANTAAENANQIAGGIDSRVKAVEDKASQVYESFDAIQSSGETDPNKIYIDGSDMQPYVYKDGKFVKFKGDNGKLQSVEKYIDLYDLLGKNCYAVYRFDEEGYYIITQNGIAKVNLDFELIYEIPLSMNNNYASNYKNRIIKVNKKLFIVVSQQNNILYMYDETTDSGKYLENPLGLQYYGSVYLLENIIYYCHSYNSTHIYEYDIEGNLINQIQNEHGELKITEGIAFTTDGYIMNLETYSFEKIVLPEDVSNIKSYYAFSNGNFIVNVAYGFYITDKSNKYGYKFSNITYREDVTFFSINSDGYGCVLYNPFAKFIFNYPHNVDNPVARSCNIEAPLYNKGINYVSDYKNDIYIVYNNSLLKIENKKLYI